MTGRDRWVYDQKGSRVSRPRNLFPFKSIFFEPEGSESELQCEASSNRKPWIALKNLQL
jgi:hypothetical protein